MSGNMGPHESKIYQRSLSDRLPDRPSADKLDSLFDQRFGYQNPLRDVNRFGDRSSFEAFSPSRLHEMVRTFDFKEIEAKLFDPSLSSEKFQRMAENFNEFRSRFQDQMFRRDGGQRSSFPFDGRNMLQEMNERNAFFNSRNENIDFASNRDRFENSRNFNGVNVNDIDNFGSNRNDLARMRSRNDMGSRTNMNSPDFNRRRESVTDNLSMSMESQLDIRRTSMNMEQALNGRNTSTNSDGMIPRTGDMSTPHDNPLSSNQRSEVLSSSESDMMAMRQAQRAGLDGQSGGMDTQQAGMDQHGGLEQRGSLDQRSRLDTTTEAEMMALRGPRASMEMSGASALRMMAAQMERPDIQNCNGMMSPNGNMIMGGSRNDNTSTPLSIVDRGSDRGERPFENRMQSGEMPERPGTDFDMMDRSSLNMSGDKDKMHSTDDMVVDNNMNMDSMQRDTEAMQMQNHPRNMPMGNLCNDMDPSYAAKRDVHIRNRELMMQDVNVHDELNPLTRSNSIPQQIGSHHSTPKQNGHDPSLQEDDMDFCNQNDDKSSPSQSLSDPNMIRQRKQRKPSNPQHVFMPSLDQYTSFATDEVEEVGALI